MANPSMDSTDPESQPLLRRNDNVNTPLTGHCCTETNAEATTPATASPGDYDFDFDPLGDVDNPLEWPTALKWGIVTLLALMAFTVYVCSLFFLLLFFPPSGAVVQPLYFPGNIFSPCCHRLPALHLCTGIPVPAALGYPRSGVPGSYPLRASHRTRKLSDSPPAPRCTTLTHDPHLRCFPHRHHNSTRQEKPSPFSHPLNHQSNPPPPALQKQKKANTPLEHSPASPPSPSPPR